MTERLDLRLFGVSDARRIETSLARIAPHFDLAATVIVGSVATSHALGGSAGRQRQLNDIDLCVQEVESVSPSITNTAYVAHFHWEDNSRRHPYLAVVDKSTGVKTDIFSPPRLPEAQTTGVVDGFEFAIIGSEQLLAAAVNSMRLQVARARVSPKRQHDVEQLLEIARVVSADQLFRRNFTDDVSLLESYRSSLAAIRAQPDLIVDIEFPNARSDSCGECVSDARFPLTPISKIRELTQPPGEFRPR